MALPEHLHALFPANEAALGELAAQIGGEVHPIDPALSATWLAPSTEYAHVRVLETELAGLRASVIVNFVRVTTSGSGARSRTTWRPHHRLAVRLHDAEVRSPLHTVEHTIPFIGRVHMPHFELGARPARDAPSAWVLPPEQAMPELPAPYRFTGCSDGVLYASTDRDAFELEPARAALSALASAASLGWRAPSPEERAARVQAGMRQGRRALALSCVGGLVLFSLLGLGIAWLASSS